MIWIAEKEESGELRGVRAKKEGGELPHDGAESLSGDDVPPLGLVDGETLVSSAPAVPSAAAAHRAFLSLAPDLLLRTVGVKEDEYGLEFK
ncbi:hypothetical protein Cni_G21947 [Canna indica]|uniref:Uncharacterized protein n=1 Tax=Canna indica TaxID=4628 RepID=A0AAQ3KU76_9LILI|nr:hypothetical protein Cni_G21947 [Canna indica]